jgi:hypothetical protein
MEGTTATARLQAILKKLNMSHKGMTEMEYIENGEPKAWRRITETRSEDFLRAVARQGASLKTSERTDTRNDWQITTDMIMPWGWTQAMIPTLLRDHPTPHSIMDRINRGEYTLKPRHNIRLSSQKKKGKKERRNIGKTGKEEASRIITRKEYYHLGKIFERQKDKCKIQQLPPIHGRRTDEKKGKLREGDVVYWGPTVNEGTYNLHSKNTIQH